MRKWAIALVVTGTLVWALPASAQTPILPTGEAKDVLIKPTGSDTVVSFHRGAAARYKVIAGRKILVTCTSLGRPAGPGIEVENSLTTDSTAPKRRRPFRAGLDAGKRDYCEVSRARFSRRRGNRRTTYGERVIATVPLTQRGAVFLDEREKVGGLFALVTEADILADRRRDGRYPPASEVARQTRGRAVALATAQDTPPAGKLGVFTNQKEITVAVLSATGRRLYIQLQGDQVATNVIEFFAGD